MQEKKVSAFVAINKLSSNAWVYEQALVYKTYAAARIGS